MKRILHKFRSLLDKEFEIPLPKSKIKTQHYVKQQTDYQNPFKHQQVAKPEPKPEPKVILPEPVAQPPIQRETPKPIEAPQPTPQPQVIKDEVTKPSVLDKKFEFTINKPKINLPKFKKPNVTKPTMSLKKPHINLPKKPALKNPFKQNKKTTTIVGIVIISVLLIGTIALNRHNLPTFMALNQPTPTPVQAQEEPPPAVKLAEKISKKIPLPTDETPISATVSDRNQLQNQAFFKDAQNGDKILMYKKSKKAFLYRPSIDTVIAQANLEFQEVAGAATDSAQNVEPTIDPNAPKTSIMPEPIHGKVLVPGHY